MRRLFRLMAFFTVFAGLLTAARAQTSGFVLEIEAANLSGGTAQLYYDIGQWYSGTDSVRVDLPASPTLKPYRFPVPAKPIKHLRFDPADGAATLLIGHMRLLTAEGAVLAEFGPDKLVAMNAIESLTLTDGVATVKTKADDPMLSIARPLQPETVRALGRTVISAGHIWAVGALLTLLLGLGLYTATRSVLQPSSLWRPAIPIAWVLAGVFLTVFGARLYWLKEYSRPMPFWDEWETDAVCLLIPLRGGFLDWESLFIPQGEHRILLTRVLNILGTLTNGEWDPRVGMVICAAFFAAGIALLSAAVVKVRARWVTCLLPLVLVWACMPFDWRNVYWGDQTQMYALNLLALCVLLIACTEVVTPLVFAGAFAASVVSLFTMGSGFVAPGLAFGLCAFRCWREPAQRRPLAILTAVFGLVTVLGLLLYQKAPYQGPGYAHTLAEFWQPFINRASWPFLPHAWAVLLVWAPWAFLAFSVLSRRPRSFSELLALGLGAWSLVNAAGLAHGRPADAPPFDSKYYTSMSVSVAAAILSTAVLAGRWPARKLLLLLALVACTCASIRTFQVGQAGIHFAGDQKTERGWNDDIIRPFLASGDPTQLRATHYSRLPYWNGAELADILDSPYLQRVLPAPLRASLAQRPNSPLHGPQTPGPLTTASRSLMKAGLTLFSVGALSVLTLIVLSLTRRPAPGVQNQ